jgi:translation initiation factor IF-2
MNISTLAKILGVSINDLRSAGQKQGLHVFGGRSTRIPYNAALEVTKVLRPEKLSKLQNDDRIYLPAALSVGDFAQTIGKPTGMVLKSLMMSGIMVTLNEKIDYDTASLIASDMGVEVFPENGEIFDSSDAPDLHMVRTIEYSTDESKKHYLKRSPVVTIMGHVDHGKTTLLDFIRKSNVVAGEAGAITQHIASYKIKSNNQNITFVDTPGHSAFTAMRARGSQLADFIILVVSSVEGPKPQTVEVIERAKITKTPIIVALNKIDLPGSDPEKVKTELTRFGLTPEEWGGSTPFIPISAKTGQNVEKLLETILLHAEIAELKGEIDCPAQAIVIESNLDKTQGVINNVLVVKGSLITGDVIKCGLQVARVKKMFDSEGKEIKKATISDPVMIIGLNQISQIGEPMVVYESIKAAQKAADAEAFSKENKVNLSFSPKAVDNGSQINVILKADVSGSLEALKESIIKIPQEQTKVVIKASSVGEVGENDVEFAETTGSTILAFHTKISNNAKVQIKKLEINTFSSDIIYEILEWVEEEIFKNIKHEVKIEVLGRAEILGVFKSEKVSIQVFGGEVKSGKLLDSKKVRIIREDQDLGSCEIKELQKNKEKVSEVNISQQFGISITGLKTKVKVGDILECIDEVIVK